ncbi:PA26 p53-induced protein-domain-containing protein [Lobosporangium transversale]|uniref:PA26 p53-induced protein-domain-containing protein n=1 Tax=Lobosporangium transversale TaxID=64571 RepID=A0A1Y2GIN7_9FUNG|nr:PA26 p53-induced protein-domain-containing protein [Lobosporangium transversale]ORZ12104.1 PA26 p53-induced protein-domain-containing protein [Lobosporangium transversale]|eukprot:XP_021879969.1 PA26 p53-induced protein-domain-containing protein [Lobosporangium transversale]
MSMVSSSSIASSPDHSTSSSASNADLVGIHPTNPFSSSPLNSSYHFQNDPDVHFNRPMPDKLSPLEERVAEVDEAARLLRHHILTILRFSVCCPYKDVKICLVGLLNELEALNIPIPKPIHPSASFFIDPKDIYMLDSPENSRCTSPTLSPKDRSSSSSSLSTLPVTPACLPPSLGCIPDEATKQIMTQTFLNYGRTSNLFRILAFFPSFWEKFESSQNCMMNGPGPIPKPWRCYVAIMAASQYNCQYMVSMMKLDYLSSGGDPTWLNGLQFTTQKIRNLAKLNGLMAHQPWLLKPRHIQELVCRESNHNPHNVWTISELAQVMVILSTVHSISMFVAACGIVPEIDMVGGTIVDLSNVRARRSQDESMSPLAMLPSPRSDSDSAAKSPSGETITSTEQTQDHATGDDITSNYFHITLPPAPASKKTYDEATSKMHTAELIKRLMMERDSDCIDEDVETEADEIQDLTGQKLPPGFEEIEDTFPAPEPKIISPSISTPLAETMSSQEQPEKKFRPVQEDMSRFLDMGCQIEPALFDCRSSRYKVYRVDQFRWEDDASALLSKYLPELSETLEDEYAETMNFTDLSFFDENADKYEGGVDTYMFREAIWFYTLRLCGLLNPEYNYRNLSRFLNTTLAAYIRKACHGITMVETQVSVDGSDCPQTTQSYLSDINKIDKNDFDNMGFELRPEERCHINIIVMEACKQAKLMYALRALDRYERRDENDDEEEDEGADERF